MTVVTAYVDQVQKAYIAYYGRPADPVGLDYWTNRLAAVNGDWTTIIDGFGSSTEATSLLTGDTNNKINQLYQQLLGRDADPSGLIFYSNGIGNGTYTLASVAINILNGIPATGTDATTVANKLTSANLFTNSMDTTAEILAYNTNTVSTVRSWLTGVVATAADQTAVDSTLTTMTTTSADASGQAFTLTTAADTGSSFTGSAYNDTFGSVVGTNGLAANGTTLNAGDNLTGGSGTDTLNVSISGTNTGTDQTTSAMTLSGVEKIKVSNYETSTFNSVIDLANSTGVTNLELTSSSDTGDTLFTSVQSLAAASMSSGGGDLSITYANTAVSGTSDTQTLALSGVTAGTFTAAATTPSATTGIETLAITSSGSARNVLTGVADATSMTTITVAGSQALTLGTVGASVTTLNAGSNTGGVTATLNALTSISVTGSTGDDSIQAAAVLATGSVAAGSGTDTLVLTDDTYLADSVVGGLYTGFETLSRKVSSTGTLTGAQDVSLLSGITTLNATMIDTTDGNADATDSVTFTKLAATTNTLNITALATAEDAHDLLATVTATRNTNTTADTMTVNLGTTTAASGATATAAAASTQVVLDVSLANEEILTLNSQGGANFIGNLTTNNLTSLTVTGNKNLSIAAIVSNANMATLNASAFTGSLSIAANAGSVNSTITSGTGNDSLTGGSANDSIDGGTGNDSIVGAAGNDTIIGGAGADSITAGAGTDSVSGGDGNDTFVVGTTTTDFASGEVVAGGSGTDTLTLGDAAFSFTAADLAGLSGIEVLTLGAVANTTAMTLTDAIYTANGNTVLTINATTATSAQTIAASGLTSANSVVLNMTATNNTAANSIVLGAGNDTVKVDEAALAAGTITGGSGTDTLTLSLSTPGGTTTMAAGITGFEVMNVASTGIAGVFAITADAAFVASGSTMTIDASNLTTGTMTFTGTAETTGKYSIMGGSGADTLLGGSGADTISGGSGADSITGGVGIDSLSGDDGDDSFNVVATGTGFTGLATAEVISGGSGNDTLAIAAGIVSVAAADLANISSVEIISIANTTEIAGLTLTDAVYTADGVTILTVNETAATSGVLTLSASGLSAANSVKLDISATNNSAGNVINLGAGNDQVTLDAVALNNTTTIAGGSGTDTLVIKANQGSAAVTIDAAVTGFETVSFTDTAGVYNLVTTDGNVASGATMTVNASNNATGTLLWNGVAELDGKFAITGGIGADTMTGGAGADTITGGSGADVITGGSGVDSLTGGAGADKFTYTAVAHSSSAGVDAVTDFVSAEDKFVFTLDYAALTTAQTVNATRASAGVAGITLAQNALSGERGQYIYDTTNSQLYVNVNNDNLITSLDYAIGVNAASTATATVVEGDLNFVITGGTAADTITAGAGADTITGGTGNDSITAGTGADVIVYTEAAGCGSTAGDLVAGANDRIVGFGTTDTIVLGATGGSFESSLIVAGGAAGAGGTIGEMSNVTTFSAATNAIVEYFDNGTDILIAFSTAADAAYTVGADVTITLAGLGTGSGNNHVLAISAAGVLTYTS